MTRPARGPWRDRAAFALALAFLLAATVVALAVGKYHVPVVDVVRVALGLPPRGAEADLVQAVLWNIRLPRVLAGLVVGAALAAAGAAYQAMFRNPLVSPDILGVSAGAGFGALLAIFLGWPVAGIQAAAFLSGLAAGRLFPFSFPPRAPPSRRCCRPARRC